MPYTDYIVVVGEGSILEQGTYTQLKDQGGYVAGLSLADATWKANDEFDDEDDETQNSESSRRTSETGTDFITAAEEANRRTGDMTVYMYYFAAVGWIVFVGMLFLLSCFTVSSTMPGKENTRGIRHMLTLEPRGMGQLVDGSEFEASE